MMQEASLFSLRRGFLKTLSPTQKTLDRKKPRGSVPSATKTSQGGEPAHHPDQANNQVGLPHRADLGMAERKADGDVALQRHHRQVLRCVSVSADDDQEQADADCHIDVEQEVSQQQQGHLGEKEHVIDHQVHEEYVKESSGAAPGSKEKRHMHKD